MRGEYDKPGEKVDAGVPASLPPLPQRRRRNRLALARWLVDPAESADGPRGGESLLADVLRHRPGEDGRGLRLAGRCAQPSRTARLAGDRVHRQRLGRQSAAQADRDQRHLSAVVEGARRQLLERDPENRLLARGPRLRLSAEMIRDQALAASGLLVEQARRADREALSAAGPVEGAHRRRRFRRKTTAPSLYRRSLYTFWKRTIAPPSMMTFDASGREACTVRETRTNTPLQALTLMNDVTFVEAARRAGRAGDARRRADARRANRAGVPTGAGPAADATTNWRSCWRASSGIWRSFAQRSGRSRQSCWPSAKRRATRSSTLASWRPTRPWPA